MAEQMMNEAVMAQARAVMADFLHELDVYQGSLSVMELNALSQNSQVGTQIKPQEVDLNLAASGNPVEMAALAGVGLTRPALALAEKIWEFAGDLSPKVKVAILCILMVALFAACSSPAIATETVVNSTPTTVSAPATLEPTATREPTKVPTATLAPTQENTAYKDYLAKTENTYPMPEVEGLASFICTADFSNVDYVRHTAADGETTILASIDCEDGGVKFTFPADLFLHDIVYIPLSLAASQTNDGTDWWFGDGVPQKILEQGLTILKVEGKKAKVRILLGTNSGSILKYADPFPRIFDQTNWDEAVTKFMRTGNPADLPSIAGIKGKFLPAIRVTILE